MGSETEPGLVMGTFGYMSPEQVRGQPAHHRADIFALGAILYEMLTGKRAFQKPTSPETMSAILNEHPPLKDSRSAGLAATESVDSYTLLAYYLSYTLMAYKRPYGVHGSTGFYAAAVELPE